MSKSVREGGAVCGPAPLDQSANVIELPVRQATFVDAAGHPAVPEPAIENLHADEPLAVARAALQNAVKSRQHLESRLDRVCSSLLIAGEQIPSFDQTDLSMLQEVYINAATAFSVASEKAILWQVRVQRLSQPGRENSGTGEWQLAA